LLRRRRPSDTLVAAEGGSLKHLREHPAMTFAIAPEAAVASVALTRVEAPPERGLHVRADAVGCPKPGELLLMPSPSWHRAGS
jgi:hypothetical protein